ncbi:MAG: MBOAT family protein [Planctomycetes bacterium]|nr:MBOAT family protein [Planctomycetota bacterium]
MVGLTKKLLIADNLATLVDPVFSDPTQYQSRDLWLAMFCYGGQIYCDFSGYTDMAIAIARMMGFDFSANFASPYLATSLSDFWRRWHISLSTWLRDYLYIPLGGSRFGRLLTARNLMLTMLLGGLWHGASWTFVIWGAIHGAALVVTNQFRRISATAAYPAPQSPIRQIAKSPNDPILTTLRASVSPWLRTFVCWSSTLLLVHLAWVFFRCQPMTLPGGLEPEPTSAALARAVYFVTHLFMPANVADPAWLMNKVPMVMLLALLLALHLYEDWIRRGRPRLRLPAPVAGIGYATWIAALVLFSPENASPFIYFQF